MAKHLLVDHQDVRAKLEKQFRRHCKNWLTGEGQWPLSIPLGLPTESQAEKNLAAVQRWQTQWHNWHGPAEVSWVVRHWHRLGKQRLPERILIRSAHEVAQWVGEISRWQQAEQRYQQWCERWPQLTTLLPRYFDLLADYAEQDFLRLEAVLGWFIEHPDCGLYIRQLPINGIDSKWLEKRRALITDLLYTLYGDEREKEFYTLTGIRREPGLIRMRILDPQLRRETGGLCDISAPVEEWAAKQWRVNTVYIVENLQTGLAFGDLAGSVVIMGLGYSVNLLSVIPWLSDARCFYWGDLDSDGFAILNRARSHIPHIESLLMDEDTLMSHQALWGKEAKPVTVKRLDCLTEKEQHLYFKLANGSFEDNVRLEQERICWDYAWRCVLSSPWDQSGIDVHEQ